MVLLTRSADNFPCVLIPYAVHTITTRSSRISQLMGIDYQFDLMISEDGSGRGAALVAAVLKRGE